MAVNGANGAPPTNSVPLLDQAMFTPRKLRLVCIGAGFSGLTLAYKIKHELRLEHEFDLQIYDKNSDVGGTWYENRYPGVACDTPAHTYVFQFEPNPNWSSFYAGGAEIWRYIKDTAIKYDLLPFVSLRSKVTDSTWNEEAGKWKLRISQDGTTIEDECDILINASGILNKWFWPKIEGLKDFRGKLLHTAHWDKSYDWTGKKIAVIGNGSSAIQIVPQLQPKAQLLVNFMRSPTWISANFLNEFTPEGANFKYTEEEKKRFRDDPAFFLELRRALEHAFNHFIVAMFDGRPEQEEVQIAFTNIMKDRLKGNEDLIARLIPAFKVGCRRLTPGDGYLEALQQENARCQWNKIVKITERGILTEEGEEEFDLIVCATGFDVSFRPSWNLVGRNGYRLDEAFRDYAKAYFGVSVAHVPNFFTYMGPKSPAAHGSLTGSLDAITDYILKWCHKIATEDIKAVCVKESAVDDLDIYSQEVLKRTVWAGPCKSWYKNGKEDGPVTALHAGSAIHYREILQDIRGEHFEFTYRSPNSFRFLGNGFSLREDAGGDLGYYLKR
ncbi:uncharacterized protein Z520_03645 [Fonsecaea multimorphosa CBS 102226]|uniref:FAD/NAD(P)-binding domain-containing protein n=1 Tax=Fonsecaea multimorphosa CBS 102226 TaxID=1442371 RepID=A0A0D2KW52_9EURO|nr:uncharacterized protein Z520_03645 [Fonsecaea multimorphosa CBS 102226]KIY00979.1 hypothetical protein Z520_03645 [Fonsecaea multimorphosa CBS 102226]OAL27564.1 hypothetical protein AYO22_03468 [Fonsecaea multimorphosa]